MEENIVNNYELPTLSNKHDEFFKRKTIDEGDEEEDEQETLTLSVRISRTCDYTKHFSEKVIVLSLSGENDG